MLSNKNLTLQMEQNGTLHVTDCRTDVTWHSAPLQKSQSISEIDCQDTRLSFLLTEGEGEYQILLETASDFEFTVSIAPRRQAKIESLYYPPAFRMPEKDYYILQTDSEGLLLPVTDTFYPRGVNPLYFCGGGLAMAWIGTVDANLESGYMITIETPYDAAIDLDGQDGLLTFAPVWLSSRQTLFYERKLRYSFFDKGGYVAQCKHYRKYVWEKNKVASLEEKKRQHPALDKMTGAVHLYVWSDARRPEFLRQIKEEGIDRAMVLWNSNHYPYPPADFDETARELGYASGAYELFTDLNPKKEITNGLPLKLNSYPGKFEKLAARKIDSSTYSNRYGTYACPAAMPEEIKARTDHRFRISSPETMFLDVYCANGLYECYNPSHPVTREGYASAIESNTRMLMDRYNLFIGGEFGAEYGTPYCSYYHGMMTLQRTWFDSETEKEGTIYYMGDWHNNENPTIILDTYTASDTYLKYAINEYTRVPLYELVYHDAVINSWRWEDGNASCPEIWWKKDLFNILYGTAPLWSVNVDSWNKYSKTYLESYRKICPWLKQICYDEMVSHRFINADHTVQESVFSSGKRVIVNFGAEPFEYDGQVVEPRSCLFPAKSRQYSRPEAAETNKTCAV